MPLDSGTHLGVYEISATIGEGGMGEVNRARDTKDPGQNKVTILTADASRLPALLVAYRLPVCSLLAPGQPSASTPKDGHLILTRVQSSTETWR